MVLIYVVAWFLIFQVKSETVASPLHVLQGGSHSTSPVRSSRRPMQRRARLPQQRKRAAMGRVPLPPSRGHPLSRSPSPRIPRWRPHLSLQPRTSPPEGPPPRHNLSILTYCPERHFHARGRSAHSRQWRCTQIRGDHLTKCCRGTDGVDVSYTNRRILPCIILLGADQVE